MNYNNNDDRREEKQREMLEDVLGIDLIKANYLSQQNEKKLNLNTYKDRKEYLSARDKMKNYSIVDCGIFYKIETEFSKCIYHGFLELKGIELRKDRYNNVVLNVSKLEELIEIKNTQGKKIYIVYTLYDENTQNVYCIEEEDFDPKDFKPITKLVPKCYIFDVDVLEENIGTYQVKENKYGQNIYHIPKELSMDLYKFKRLISKDKYDNI